MRNKLNNQQGMGLMEVLVTSVIMAVGLLAVASFHSSLIRESQGNKARAEAIALAQARIEQLRNYTLDATTEADFEVLFTNTNGYVNGTAVTGVNAVFTRDESVSPIGDTKQVDVRVAWSDSGGAARQIVLSTELGYEQPRSGADLSVDLVENFLPSVQGRAKLGEGDLPDGAPTTMQDDGTELYDAGDGDLRLVLGDDVVLTLIDACRSGTCTDFAKISGRVYIDTANSSTEPGSLFVTASDAAFCQRYYEDEFGNIQTVTVATSSTSTTANGDYEYFDYNCYVGGGWRGNIGLLLDGGVGERDKTCVGDPVNANGWNLPTIVARRAYRGMLYKQDTSTQSGKEEYTDQYGDTRIRYYSIGIRDAAELPGYSGTQHDFVFTELLPSQTEGYHCLSEGVLVRPDANVSGTDGDLFAGNEDDFVCLNDNLTDAFDSGEFGVDVTCPFDPTDPPVGVHVITGEVAIAGTIDDDHSVGHTTINTSDGEGNCLLAGFNHADGTWRAGYACTVYDWGNTWSGHIILDTYLQTISCSNTTIGFSNLSSDSSGNDFACSAGEDLSEPDGYAIFSGTVQGTRKLTGAAISDGGTCTVAADGLSYTCTTEPFNSVWSVSIAFTKNGGVWCTDGLDGTSGIATFLDFEPGEYTYAINIVRNSNRCNL